MVIVKANKDSEAGALPDGKMLAEMGKFNEELVKAGVMLAGEGPAELEGCARSIHRRKADRNRRALYRVQGAGRRLLALAGQVEGRGDRMDQARSVQAWRRDRDPPGVRGGRLRPERPDRRSAGQGGSAPEDH